MRLKHIHDILTAVRKFAFYNKTLIEVGFLLIYMIEQILLVYFSTQENSMQSVSYFAVIVLTTFGIHKVFMESRMKIMEQKITSLINTKETTERIYKNLFKKHT